MTIVILGAPGRHNNLKKQHKLVAFSKHITPENCHIVPHDTRRRQIQQRDQHRGGREAFSDESRFCWRKGGLTHLQWKWARLKKKDANWEDASQKYCNVSAHLELSKCYLCHRRTNSKTESEYGSKAVLEWSLQSLNDWLQHRHRPTWVLPVYSAPYLIFVILFTLTYFEVWKFYTQKCVNLLQKLPRDKIA